MSKIKESELPCDNCRSFTVYKNSGVARCKVKNYVARTGQAFAYYSTICNSYGKGTPKVIE